MGPRYYNKSSELPPAVSRLDITKRNRISLTRTHNFALKSLVIRRCGAQNANVIECKMADGFRPVHTADSG